MFTNGYQYFVIFIKSLNLNLNLKEYSGGSYSGIISAGTMDMPDKLTGDSLVESLKQLLINIEPHLKTAATIREAEDALVHLEEYDPKFESYDFVKGLNQYIENKLGRLLDEEMERQSLHPNDSSGGQETVVSNILQSQEYQQLTSSLRSSVNEAVKTLLDNYEEEFNKDAVGVRGERLGGAVDGGGHGARHKSHIPNDSFMSSDEECSLASSYMFLSQEEQVRVAKELSKRNSVEVRMEALRKLSKEARNDFSNSSARPMIRQGLQEALADKDETLAKLTLKFIARGLSSNDASTIEPYTTLVEHLSMEFRSSKSKVPMMISGLKLADPNNNRLIRCMTLMNEFQITIPHYWVRFSVQKFLDDILEYTLSLLSIQYTTDLGGPAHISPIHILSLIDTRAYWFNRWMHGHYSREPLLIHLRKYRNIVDTAVRYAIEYAHSRQMQSQDAEPLPSNAPPAAQKGVYSEEEMEFTYFIHSLHLLGRLLCYESGRAFFPVKLRDREVTLSTLLVTFVSIITETAPVTPRRHFSPDLSLDPCVLVTSLLKKLCCNELVAAKTMCTDEVTNALLAPVNHMLDGSEDLNISETILLRIADVLAMIASCGIGRQHLLYGEARERLTKTRSSAAHVLASFAKRSLNNELSPGFNGALSKAVIGNFVYVCRQLYNTCEGLVVVYPYDVHTSIAAAWKVANCEADQAATPTPSMASGGGGGGERQLSAMWEDTLRDNLLNFAGTPKGLLLLQQTGAISECVSYMHSRYARKVQVGKCEKFGYGYMLSQVTATAVGMVALLNTGFISTLTKSLWAALEVADDHPVYTPRTWATSDIDKGARKLFVNLVNVLSSFTAVYEVLGGRALPDKHDYGFRCVADTIVAVLDRLVFLDNENKFHSLFNVEQSHMFGLCLVRLMITCLDTFLLLQTQYQLQESLLTLQDENRAEEGGPILMDMTSLERNYILVKTSTIGGPTERVIPPRKPSEDDVAGYKYPLFSSYPLPPEYIMQTAKSAMKQETDLSKYLTDTKKVEPNKDWLVSCRKAFCSVLTTRPDQAKTSVLQDLLERVVYLHCKDQENSIFPFLEYTGSDSALRKHKLNKMQELGIKMTVKYGQQLKLLTVKAEEAEGRLTQLLKKCSYYLQQQQRAQTSSRILCLKTGYAGYDWFASTLFLMMNGNLERTWKFLHKFSTLISSAYLWIQRLHSSQHVPPLLMQSGIPVVFSSTCHHVELILQTDLPHVYSAFKVSGFAPAQICQHWIRQCFWNYLDWPEICHYVCVCLLLGVDYQVYLCVAIFKYLQRSILQKAQEKSLIFFLKEEPLTGFRVGEHLEYMQQLESKFRQTILPDMHNLSKP